MDYKKLYVLRTKLKGFRGDSAEMQMMAEVIKRKKDSGLQAYLDTEVEGAHKLLEHYCKQKGVNLEEIRDLREFMSQILKGDARTYVLVTKRGRMELQTILRKLDKKRVDIEEIERNY